jgi:hypothetical protein
MYIVLLSLLLLLLLILLYNNLCHYKWFPSEKGACGKPSKAACTGLLDKLRELELGGARTERNGTAGLGAFTLEKMVEKWWDFLRKK